MKKFLCLLTSIIMLFALCSCGSPEGYGVKTVQTLVEQDYSLAFRVGDVTIFYVSAAIQVLNANGTLGELGMKWFGSASAVSFPSDAQALEKTGMPEARTLIVGLDDDAFPFAYKDANEQYWGYDVELAGYVCELLGWTLELQPIENVNTYIELSSGNIDCAWGGIALDQKLVDSGKYEQLGPYIHNDIVIAARAGSGISGKIQLSGKSMAMSTSDEAMEALRSDPKLENRLGQIIRLTGGSVECFRYLYDNRCDVVLTDSTAMLYYNNR